MSRLAGAGAVEKVLDATDGGPRVGGDMRSKNVQGLSRAARVRGGKLRFVYHRKLRVALPAFIAGFAWNAAFSALVGDDGVAGWPWIAAAGWTAAAAGYAAVEESVREVKAALEETKNDDERRVNAGGL